MIPGLYAGDFFVGSRSVSGGRSRCFTLIRLYCFLTNKNRGLTNEAS